MGRRGVLTSRDLAELELPYVSKCSVVCLKLQIAFLVLFESRVCLIEEELKGHCFIGLRSGGLWRLKLPLNIALAPKSMKLAVIRCLDNGSDHALVQNR